MTDSIRHQRVMDLFDAVCDVPVSDRAAFLARECAGDAALQAEVESLLAHDSQTYGPVENMEDGKAAAWLADDLERDATVNNAATGTALPERIGRYRVIRMIGRGGMGVVYEAEQENPKRRVALKMVRPGMIGRQLQRRLQREANVLGRLQHPGIAQVHEAGMVDVHGDTLPYFAMEYVDGVRITDFVSKHAMALRQRLALLVRICDAVHHAHQMGVIHRDLKPANILVVPTEAESGRFDTTVSRTGGSSMLDTVGQPKVLDFGIARVTDGDIQAATIQTDIGQLVGTLSYMSPEQVAGDSTSLDARCDVYALGVLMYELLTGRLPLDISNVSVAEAARIIRDDEPEAAGLVNRSLRGDIETIIGKAIQKDREQHYLSAAHLAADIRRFLEDEPIVARPASALYNLRKFARRNKGLVAGLSAALVILLLGATGTTIGLISSLRANDRLERTNQALADSNRQLEESNESLKLVSEFQSSQLTDIDVALMGVRMRNDLVEAIDEERREAFERQLGSIDFIDIARETLDQTLFTRAVSAIDDQFADQPLLQATMLQDVATTMRELGLLQSALAPQQRSLAIRRKELGNEHADIASSLNEAGMLMNERGDYDAAGSHYTEAISISRRVLGEKAVETLTVINNHAETLRALGKHEEAESVARELVLLLKQEFGIEHATTLNAMAVLANVLNTRGAYEESKELFREVVAGRRKVLGEDHISTISVMRNLATVLENLAEYEESIALTMETWERHREKLGANHPATLSSMMEYGARLLRQGKLELAEPILHEALSERRRILGDDHESTIRSMESVASLLEETGRLSESEALFRESYERKRRTLGKDHPSTLRALGNLGYIVNQQGRTEEAEPLYRQTLSGLRRAHGDEHPHTLTSIGNLASLLSQLNKHEEAEPLYIESLEGRRKLLGDDHPSTLNATYNMGSMFCMQSQFKKAEPYARKALEGYRRVGGDDHIGTLYSLGLVASVLISQGRHDEALPYCREAVDRRMRINGTSHPQTVIVTGFLLDSLENLEMWSDAETWHRRLVEHARGKKDSDAATYARRLVQLGGNLLRQGKLEDALASINEGIAQFEVFSEPDDWELWAARSLKGKALSTDPARYAEAESLLLACHAALSEVRTEIPEEAESLQKVRDRLAKLYESWSKPDQAAAWRAPSPD